MTSNTIITTHCNWGCMPDVSGLGVAGPPRLPGVNGVTGPPWPGYIGLCPTVPEKNKHVPNNILSANMACVVTTEFLWKKTGSVFIIRRSLIHFSWIGVAPPRLANSNTDKMDQTWSKLNVLKSLYYWFEAGSFKVHVFQIIYGPLLMHCRFYKTFEHRIGAPTRLCMFEQV